MRRTLAIAVILPCFLGCQRPAWKPDVAVPKHLYSYSPEALLATIGDDKDLAFFNAGRNAGGTLVIARDTAGTGPAYIFTRGEAAPRVVENPHGGGYWLDEQGDIAAWLDADDPRTIHTAGGGTIVSPPATAGRGIDASGRYYFESVPAERRISVLALDDPGRPLIEYESSHAVAGLWTRGERIYILEYFGPGWRLEWGRWHRGLSQAFRVFEPAPDGFREAGRIDLPEARFVLDVDPWSDAVLLTDDYGDDAPRHKYLFDTSTGELVSLGPVSLGVPLFLAEDVIGDDRLAPYRRP